MKTILFGLLVFLWACNNEKSLPNESQPVNDTAKISITISELIKDTTTWELLDDSVIVDNVLCEKYRNKKTNQIVMIAYE